MHCNAILQPRAVQSKELLTLAASTRLASRAAKRVNLLSQQSEPPMTQKGSARTHCNQVTHACTHAPQVPVTAPVSHAHMAARYTSMHCNQVTHACTHTPQLGCQTRPPVPRPSLPAPNSTLQAAALPWPGHWGRQQVRLQPTCVYKDLQVRQTMAAGSKGGCNQPALKNKTNL